MSVMGWTVRVGRLALSRRWWTVVAGICAAAVACSGKSTRNGGESDGDDDGGVTAGGAGGTSAGHAGEPGDDGSVGTSSGGAMGLTATAATGSGGTSGTTQSSASGGTDSVTSAATGSGGASSVPAAPEGWTCSPFLYGNGVCHCGCGVVDVDCASASVDDCEVCWAGCTGAGCPGPIDPDNNATCTGVSPNWRCDERFWGDGSLCHCGCGAFDPDCDANDIEACDRCDFEGSCSAGECPGTIDPDNISSCDPPDPPADWVCVENFYADGNVCHCGCGAVDLDCPDDSIDSCQNCEVCGYAACDIIVDPEDIASCRPTPPGWTCSGHPYGDGYADGIFCDCGCGVPDPDCGTLAASSCEVCSVEYGSCAEDHQCTGIDPEDNTRCIDPVPSGWLCDRDAYGDEACDCGCGVRDVDCSSGDPGVCDLCDAEGSCSNASCDDLVEDDNASCVTETP